MHRHGVIDMTTEQEHVKVCAVKTDWERRCVLNFIRVLPLKKNKKEEEEEEIEVGEKGV